MGFQFQAVASMTPFMAADLGLDFAQNGNQSEIVATVVTMMVDADAPTKYLGDWILFFFMDVLMLF